ncbi:MAG TPA: serine hydrolase domain-containing protein [Mycobacteriales bacterium]|nr:serine hydrolase domain-containing protein [Mycobacteriales bacterium]
MTTRTVHAGHGFTAPGFEPVRDLLAASPKIGAGGAAFAAYVDGELVLDVHAGNARLDQPWESDTLAVLMSVTKSFMAFCLQILDDRGELDIEAKIGRYWPEFATNGKEDITVRQVQMHSAGLIRVPPQLRLMEGDGEGWDAYDEIADALAGESPVWEPGTDHGYHALTYGWLAGEILRRITGMSPGAFFRQEVVDPLGLDIHLGLDDAAFARLAHIIDFDPDDMALTQRLLMPRLTKATTDPATYAGMAFGGTGGGHSVISDVVALTEHGGILRAEVMSSSACSTAAALARFWSVLALGGEVDGRRLVSPDSIRKWTTPVIRGGDRVLTQSLPGWMVKLGKLEKVTAVTRTLGYLYNDAPAKGPRAFGPTPTAFGGLGAGGQVGFADPVRRVSGGFVRNALTHKPDLGNEVIAAFYECLDRRGS